MNELINPIETKADEITVRIQELVKNKFTGSINVTYNFKEGRLMGLEFTSKENIIKNVGLIHNLKV